MISDFENIKDYYYALKSEKDEYSSLWQSISRYVGIGVDSDYDKLGKRDVSRQLDEFIDDPTGAISVNQASDYLTGIIWGTGDNILNIVPSQDVLNKTPIEAVDDWYSQVTRTTLTQMNHHNSGLGVALKSYMADQFSFGNSGIGAFLSPDFKSGVSPNALIFRMYGIDNTCIDEGLNGLPEVGFAVYKWKLNRILKEFCTKNGKVSQELIAEMPKKIKDAYNQKKFNEEFNLVWGFFPRDDFDPKYIGKRGSKYRGVWFLEEEGEIFREESYRTKPVAFARQMKVRGEKYGRSYATLLLSTIRSVNFMVGNTLEILEKQGNPSLGIMNSALFGDSVLDTSPNGLTVFNNALASGGGNPIFPIYDVGDPTGIIKVMIPYLNEKITTAFKIDALLDFNSAKDMTATESLQRYAIRGKSLAGLLVQQKSELLSVLVVRCIQLLEDAQLFGIDPELDPDAANILRGVGRADMVIPSEVIECMKAGKPWFEIQFNNELEKLTRTETVENLLKVLQTVGAIAGLYPAIVDAVDWYKLLNDINSNLDANNQILVGAEEFKKIIAEKAQAQAQMMGMQGANLSAQTQNQLAQAGKANRE